MPHKEILACIKKNYRNPNFDINTLHDSTKESASNSRFVFKQEYGCSLQDILEIVRVAYALKWLADNREIEAIYRNVGFATPKTLRDAFRRRFGCSPSKCRALLVEAKNKHNQIDYLLRALCGDNERIYRLIISIEAEMGR